MENSNKVELYRQMSRLVKKLKRKSISLINKKNLYPGEFRVLSLLDINEGISPGDIAKRWSMHPSNITITVNLLIKRGYAIKKRNESDKRRMRIFITDEGEAVKNEYFAEFEKKIGECLENVSDDKIERALDAVNDILGQV
ncbi:MAG: MarR family transcriptional regulator [Clostridia bacterium]|nr:MarR family transcriptional regulator [Clostridia bacterium]